MILVFVGLVIAVVVVLQSPAGDGYGDGVALMAGRS